MIVAVEAVRPRSDVLELHYVLRGRTDELLLPAARAARFTDELWRHTCFEAFLRGPVGEAYYEFNFAPSMQWASYRFDAYRSGMTRAETLPVPHIEAQTADGLYELRITLDLGRTTELSTDLPWRLGLCAVIEEKCGRLSYWALTHPRGRPDFHHSDCFTLQLAGFSQS